MNASPRNVLIFVADDQTHRSIGCLNNPEVRTPHLDRLVRRGTAFTRAFHQGSWAQAVCVPSRAMLHTGRSLYRCGGPTCGDHPLLGETFGAHGYHTYATGKWHNQDAALGRSFREEQTLSLGMAMSTGFDFEANAPAGDPAQSAYGRPALGNVWAADDESRRGHWMPTREDPGRIEHSSTRWADDTIRYLKGRAGSDEPFLAYCAFHAPHDPRQAPTEFLDMYPVDAVELPPNYLPEHPFDQGDARVRDEQLAPWPRTQDVVRTHRREYHAILSHMDAQLGRVLDALDEAGLADQTLVVYTADHGLAVGEHGLMGKQNLYDHSLGVPLVFAGPGVRPGARSDALVYQHSVFATVAELCGVEAPAGLDFPSLAPLLRGGGLGPHETLYGAYRDYQRTCRDRRHKLILYPHLGRYQLFDTIDDPFETHDLALEADARRRHRGVAQRLAEGLLAWQEAVGDGLALDLGAYGWG